MESFVVVERCSLCDKDVTGEYCCSSCGSHDSYLEEFRVFNGTPHAINVVEGATLDPAMRKFVGGEVINTIPSTKMLNAKIESVQLRGFGNFLPLFDKDIVDCDEYPSSPDVVVVSVIYASAYRKKFGFIPDSMYVVADPVMSSDGKTFLGCRGLTKPF